MSEILIVDDQEDIITLLSDILVDEGYTCTVAPNSEQALSKFRESNPTAAILDIWLEEDGIDGVELLKEFKKHKPWLPIIMISGHGTIETAVHSIQLGAYDFIEKPFKEQKLLITLQRAIEAADLAKKNLELSSLNEADEDLIGDSKAIQNIKKQALTISGSNSRILIMGEAGTGKEVLARSIHRNSSRNHKPFVILHAANISSQNIEKELFGDLQTGYIGILERANGGTLFIDEVSEMPLDAQAKFLKFLQEKTFYKVGSNKPIESDIRIITASSKDLKEEVDKGNLNQSLFYRINVVPLIIPPVRERREDILLLIDYFIAKFAEKLGVAKVTISPEAYGALETYEWPGNTREVKNTIERLMIMRSSEIITPNCLPNEIYGSINDNSSINIISASIIAKPLKSAREEFEKEYLKAQLHKFNDNISKTASFIGMERTALHRKLKNLNISLKT